MITQIEEFKELIEGSYGITNLKSYDEYKTKTYDRLVTKDEIEKLSPDNVDSSSFWEYIEKNPEIAKDAICFGVKKEDDITEVNNRNFQLACELSTINYILKCKDFTGMNILDIGAGYGMLKDFIEKYTTLTYNGVDVYPKISGVCKVGSDGSTMPDTIMSKMYGLVVSTNVFQHLSVKQRRHYYEQISKILYPNCVFSVSQVAIFSDTKRTGFKAEDGKEYCCHYGQWTEIQPLDEIVDDLSKYFNIISTLRRNSSITFHCSLRPKPMINRV